MMIKFFGLRNKQTKRLLVRKLIIFLLQLIKESRFVAIFKNNLKEIGEKEENELVKKYCSIYSMLFKMS